MELVHQLIHTVVELGAAVIEIFGICYLLYVAVKCIIDFFQGKHIQLQLEKGISLALSFLMCAEVLKTVIAESVQDLVILAAIVVIRTAMSILLHWEMKREREEMEVE